MLLLVILSFSMWVFILLGRMRILGRIPKIRGFGEAGGETDALVSAIIPARNEEGRIGRCIESLLEQGGVRLEVIVVDDNSSDRTAEIVARYSDRGVVLVEAGDVEEGWQGKAYASYKGFLKSRGDWLLFMDADDVMKDSNCLAKTLEIGRKHGAELITLYPRLRMPTPSLKATIPILLLALYFIGKPHRVAEGKAAFAFGSFTLIKREAYEKIGGHKAVRDAILEDKALAFNAKKHGLKMLFIDGTECISSSWNYDMKTLWSGMLRLFTPLFMKSTLKRATAFLLLLAFLFFIPLVSLVYSLLFPNILLLALTLTTLALITVTISIEARKHGVGLISSVLWPIGSVIITLAVLVASYMAYRGGVVEWRGRRYRIIAGEDREIAIPTS